MCSVIPESLRTLSQHLMPYRTQPSPTAPPNSCFNSPTLPIFQPFCCHQPGATLQNLKHRGKHQMLPSREDHWRPRGQASLPPLHGISSDPDSGRTESLWGFPGTRRLCDDRSSLLGKVRNPGDSQEASSQKTSSEEYLKAML